LEEQSALNFVQFIHADKRSKMAWFGVFSDERYYVVQGNDRIARGVAAGLRGPLRSGCRLTAIQRLSDGRIELTFANRTRVAHDAVVLALPFTVLRSAVALHRNLGLSDAKRNVIANLGYGMNAKMAIGFQGTPWRNPAPFAPEGSDGNAYTHGLPAAQVVFPAAPYEGIEAPAPNGRAILVDYSGGRRGAALNPSRPQEEGEAFLRSLDVVWPGTQAAAMRDDRGRLSRVRLDHWPSNPNTLGSYTCYLPGQFTTMSGLEAESAGNLFFAGEHTDSFYSWQGFMEGACLSGIRAAGEILG
jgi:monoamine oxidase